MAKLKRSYFDFHDGRGEPALSMGGIPFEDDRVPSLRVGAAQAERPSLWSSFGQSTPKAMSRRDGVLVR